MKINDEVYDLICMTWGHLVEFISKTMHLMTYESFGKVY